MLNFRNITIDDKNLMESYFKKNNFQACEYSFATLFIWKDSYNTQIAEYGGYLTAVSQGAGRRIYLYPAGINDDESLAACLKAICRDGLKSGQKWNIAGISKENAKHMEELLPGTFSYTSNRGWHDYIYNAEDLSELTGKKYHAKRNHISQFIAENGEPDYRDITADLIPDCLSAYEVWLEEKGGLTDEYRDEYLAVKNCFDYYDQLELMGGAIVTKGAVCAFTIASRLNTDTIDVHIEKSVKDCPRGFAVINQQFARRMSEKFKYINREEDMGIEGLRKAKLSYRPAYLLEKYMAKPKKADCF